MSLVERNTLFDTNSSNIAVDSAHLVCQHHSHDLHDTTFALLARKPLLPWHPSCRCGGRTYQWNM